MFLIVNEGVVTVTNLKLYLYTFHRGIAIHTFHGNFFVRSTDLLSLPNVSPDAGFGMQLTIEESLSDLQQVCFQAALLYTSSKGNVTIALIQMRVVRGDQFFRTGAHLAKCSIFHC